MLVALGAIALGQANRGKNNEKVKKFLNYVASYQDSIVTYDAISMILSYHSNVP